MKKYIASLITLFLMCSLPSFSQTIFEGIEGIKQGDNLFFVIDGTTIDVIIEKGNLTEKGLKKIKKKFEFKTNVQQYSDSTLTEPNVILSSKESVKEYPELEGYKYCFIQAINEKEICSVCFQSTLEIPSSLISDFMKVYHEGKLEEYTTTNMRPTEIDFAGRKVDIGNGFYWQYVNNLKSNDGGQLNWSLFQSEERARAYLNTYMMRNNKPKGFKILSEEDANIIFEGKPTTTKKFIIQLAGPKFLMGPYNILIVYYVVQKIGDQYIACVLSYTTDDKDSNRLPYSLSRFMQLKKPVESN